ncbi:unnamed protein product [Phytophthora fragariaefolia]|uniref:Unnamed protein product n=1 Tax=Phytophthora fragariaefolia TaxID=1490495 RepID=A0A9W7DB28_9STRA|nr:unnamed protein product [Phytophthora fragariaefolia]
MNFVIPLPKSRRGNTTLLLFQCAFTEFVMVKAMSDTSALCVAQAFDEYVYRRFGAPSLVRHDRDPRFMSEVFQAFTEMVQSRSRTTLSYRPQANGQQERSVKTVMQSVWVYAEHPLQQDREEIVERLVFGINNMQDTTRKETPFLSGTWLGRPIDTYPVVLVSRLRAVREFGDRPKVRLARELTVKAILDFDVELLPEDSWELDMLAGEYEVESILNDRRPMETSCRRLVREFLVKWVGYDEPTWEAMTNLSCEGLLYGYSRKKRSSHRFQKVQVADED